jgi:hypothetical protein
VDSCALNNVNILDPCYNAITGIDDDHWTR